MDAHPGPPKAHGATVTLLNLNPSLNLPKVDKLREIQEAERVDVFSFADALEKFGLCDLAFIAQQAKRRLEFLDYLSRLASDLKTTEQQMHHG